MITINKKQITYNRTKRTQKPDYIVIHDTGNTGKGADANAHFNYFNSGNRNSSADFFVDDTQVLQINDYNTFYTWHCGDGKGKYGINNSNSIGIEICINSDGNYTTAFENTIRLTKQLMVELEIKADHVVRHYDASRKNCPASMSKNNWKLWDKFKKQISEEEEKPMTAEERTKFNALVEAVGTLAVKIDKLEHKMIYAWVDDNMPEWAKPTITKLMAKGYLKGDEEGKLGIDENMLRMLVINDRAGIYGD